MNIFGFQITKQEKPAQQERVVSFAVPQNEDGATVIASTNGAGGYFGTVFDIDTKAATEAELITRYRETAMYPDCDSAIEEICAEAISAEDDEEVVQINLEDVELPPKIRSIIEEEFEGIMQLLDFDSRSHDIFKRWYVDGRAVYHKIVDSKNPKLGIKELRYIDPRKIKKVREVKKQLDPKTGIEVLVSTDEFFLYSERGLTGKPQQFNEVASTTNVIKIRPDAISYITSGLIDLDKNMVLSHLHKAVKPTNMLKLAEDAMLIYRLSRAPERRVFYVDVGNLPNAKADQYLKNVMNRFRNKIVYDASTGEVRDDRKHMSMMEDFWLPRREGGTGTQVQTLEGAQNLGVTEDIAYYQTKLFQALNVPVSRLQSASPLNFGRQMEITRDELKFSKFIGRLRRRFTELFDDLLKTQLILKGVMTEDDWELYVKPKIKYVFASDIYWAEAKEIENLRNRVDILTQLEPFVGVYFSKNYVKKKVLRQNDDEIEQMREEMDEERDEMMADAQLKGEVELAQQQPSMMAQTDAQIQQQQVLAKINGQGQ